MNDEVCIRVTEEAGHLPLVTVTGPLDLYSGPQLYRQATAVLARHPSLMVDLAGVTTCDSSGLNTILRLCRRAREARGRLVLVSPPALLDRLMPLAAGESALVVHHSVEEARTRRLAA
ncbi:anti-sigma factor antagonist [Streptomyces sp. Ru71]|uniref:STAS domain-containing protein n=1 Tax=Streptomyces sp. Ru71 TaxID=2080746 RepID=UPI000CDCE4F4|nr:STAS domain-containing protein [Streptomyces sp. Ru71]POX52521.1 anti-sigma factor antagonist [Streptomyces sp. Ru71]